MNLGSYVKARNFGTGLSTIVENDESAEPTDWLHRNNNYVPGRRGPRTVLSRPLPTSSDAGQHINHILDFFSVNKIKQSSYIFYCAYIYYIILYIYAEFHLHQLRGNHVSGNSKGDEFDPELFEPTHNGDLWSKSF